MCFFCVSLCFQKNLVAAIFLETTRSHSSGYLGFRDVLCALVTHRAMTATAEQSSVKLSEGSADHDSLTQPATMSLEKETEASAAAAVDPGEKAASADAAPDTVTCRRCNQKVAAKDALETPKFRLDLRWTCKPCHACQTTLARHGVELKSLLSEDDAVAFFLQAKVERDNAADGRLSYTQCRGLLKQRMIESESQVSKEGEMGQFQPLSFWELKGYNTDNIQRLAESRDHPLLGTTYRVDIDTVSRETVTQRTEERILSMESDYKQKKMSSASKSVAGQAEAPQVRGDLLAAGAEPTGVNKRKQTTEEKKEAQEAAKAQRQEDKRRKKVETTAVAAAGKLLPALQQAKARLESSSAKLAALSVSLPTPASEQVEKCKECITEAVNNATKMLAGAAKGSGLSSLDEKVLLTDKQTGAVLKQTTETIKLINDFVRAHKAPVVPKAKAAKAPKK